MEIPFNKPFFAGNEVKYMADAVARGKISGNGYYSNLCHEVFRARYNFRKCLLTSSCTDALEMAAILCDLQPGDEVIVPSYTFVSTANAFVLRGAKIVFADSRSDHPGMDEESIERLITSRTRVIVPVHYGGVACDMDKIMDLAEKHNLIVVEDAAQAIDSYYKGKPLGGIGHLGCFSFHETKNIISGEGGMLIINDERFCRRSEIIWEKGTNRAEFFRGEVNKYGWVDIGSSFLPSELIAAFLFAQLEKIDQIQQKRLAIWFKYLNGLKDLMKEGFIRLPFIPSYAKTNGHLFYIITDSLETRTSLISFLKEKGIISVFHYLPLEQSFFMKKNCENEPLFFSTNYSECLIRLPMFFDLDDSSIDLILTSIHEFFKN